MKKVLTIVVLAMGVGLPGPAGQAAQQTLFVDGISGYDTSTTAWYYELNPAVVRTQNNGGWTGVGTTVGPWTTTLPKQLVNVASGVYGSYTTLAVPRDSSVRYGQVMVRLAKRPSAWLRLVVCDTATPVFPGYWDYYPWTGYSHAGPDLMWHPGGNLMFFTGGYSTDTGVAPTTTDFYDITINYNLDNKTWECWYNQAKVFGPVGFDGQSTFTTPKSIALAAAYWGNDPIALSFWHWKVSDDQPFTSYGTRDVPIPFYASMDGTYSGTGLGATVTPQGGTPTFTTGKRGQALLAGSDLGHLVYTTTTALPTTTGTVEFWVCPEDWNGTSDEQFHVWFVSQGPTGWLQMYKYYQTSRLMFFLTGSASPNMYTVVGAGVWNWTAGQWHHLVGTWSPLGSALYVDGQPAGSTSELRYPQALPLSFGFGDYTPVGHSRLDELYLYDRPLTGDEVAWAYAHTTDRDAGKDVPGDLVTSRVQVQVKPSPARHNALIQVLALGAGLPDGLAGQITIATGGSGISVPLAMNGGRYAETTIALDNVTGGDYPVQVVLTSPAGEFGRGQATLPWAGNPTWRGNTLGLTPVVSVGYTPTVVSGTHFQCIGRDYNFNTLGLPQQVTSAGNDLLAGPVTLEVTTSSGSETFASSSFALTPVDAGNASLAATSASARFNARISAEAAFDGLIKCTVSLTPKSATTLTRAVLHIPVKDGSAELFHYFGREPAFGRLPTGSGTLINGPFCPFIWTGNNDAGLMFMCESDEPFANATPQSVYRFVRTGSTVEMQAVLVDTPVALSAEWKVVFGLQASPVRPLEKGWRQWTMSAGSRPRATTLWPTPPVMKYFGYPEVGTDPQSLTSQVQGNHAAGTLLLPYINPSMLSGGSPEWKQFGQDWKLPGYLDAMDGDVTSYQDAVYGVSSGASDWRDFLVWKTKAFLEAYDLDGLYYDHTLAFSCDNQLMGEGYTRNGTRYPTYNIFSKRELYRRLYNMVKAMPKSTFIFAHISDQMSLPYLAFCDGYCSGEYLYRTLKDNYLDLETLDYYRTEFVGYPWGCKPYWLDEISGDYASSTTAFRHWTGLCLLLDCNLWPVVGNAAEANAILNTVQGCGWGTADFVPYWKNQSMITGQTDSVKVSAYKSDQGTLLCVLNLTRTPQQVTLHIDPAAFNLPATFTAKDARTNQAIPVQNQNVAVSLDTMDLKLVFLPMQPGTLTGTVTVRNYSASADLGIRIDFKQGGSIVRTERQFLDAAGRFTISTAVPGTYDITIKESRSLGKMITGVSIVANQTTDIGTVVLVNGDTDGDNAIGANDLAIVLSNLDRIGN